jgi:penicillin amidase
LVRYQQYDLGFDAYSDLFYTESRALTERVFSPTSEDPQLARRAGVYYDLFRQAPADKTYQVPGFGGESKPGRGRAGSKGASKGAGFGGWKAPSKPALDAAVSFFEHPKSGPGLELFARGGASNSWAVSGSMTQSGNAMLANDPHLSLASPALFYQTHLVVEPATDADGPRVNAMGAIFPGLPGLLIGHNDKVAWALTTAGYDYTDVYAEELVWTEGEELPKVRHNGQEVALEVVEEEVGVGLFGNVTERVTVKIPIVPHHGPLMPQIEGKELKLPEGDEALSFAWTGFDPSDEISAVLGFMTAQDMGEVKEALTHWKVGTQNLIFVDVEGNVFTTGVSEIPARPEAARSWDRDSNPEGWAPWWVLKGTGEHDWTGRLDRDLVPHAENPAAGFVVTANNDQAGVTDDNHPLNDYAYVGADFDLGFRAGRIERRLTNATGERPEGQKLTLEDLGAIQTDNYSNLGARVAPHMVALLERAMEELDAPGTHPNLTAALQTELIEGTPYLNGLPMRARLEVLRDLLEGWSFEAEGRPWDVLDEAGRLDAGATSLFNFWFVALVHELLDDEWEAAEGLRLGDQTTSKAVLFLLESPTEAATYDEAKGDSALWDDLRTVDIEEDRDAILVRALRVAEQKLVETFARSSPDVWNWGLVHHRTFNSIIPDIAGGVSPLTLPQPVNGDTTPYPRGGDNYTVDACNGGVFDYSFGCGGGAIMRFLVELDPEGVRSYNAQPGGQVWDNNSPHFSDLLDIWLANDRYELAFHPDDVAAQIETHLLFKP